MTTPLIITHLQISKTLTVNGLETSRLRRSALFQHVKIPDAKVVIFPETTK
jgi:hypothetical protein